MAGGFFNKWLRDVERLGEPPRCYDTGPNSDIEILFGTSWALDGL